MPYIGHGRRVNGGKPSRGRRSEGQRRSPTELHAIRQWANEQGLQVSDRGRIAADINSAAAHAARKIVSSPLRLKRLYDDRKQLDN